MSERRNYEATREMRHLYGSRRRMATRRNELILGMRSEGNAYHPVSAGPTTARPPFALDPEDDPEFDYHPDDPMAQYDPGPPPSPDEIEADRLLEEMIAADPTEADDYMFGDDDEEQDAN